MSILFTARNGDMKRPVRRCLFERPTPEKQEKDFESQENRLFQQEAEDFKAKWGLDPKTGSIVNGAEYECVPVDLTKESVPSFYTKGYAPRKPRPVQSLRRERPHHGHYISPTRLNFESPKPIKRRFPLDDDNTESDENCEIIFHELNAGTGRVPVDGEVVISPRNMSSNNSSVPASSSPTTIDSSSSPISIPSSSCFHKHLNGILPSMSNISPRSTDLCTPQQRPRSLTQKTINDYLPVIKKQRCGSKSLPRN